MSVTFLRWHIPIGDGIPIGDYYFLHGQHIATGFGNISKMQSPVEIKFPHVSFIDRPLHYIILYKYIFYNHRFQKPMVYFVFIKVNLLYWVLISIFQWLDYLMFVTLKSFFHQQNLFLCVKPVKGNIVIWMVQRCCNKFQYASISAFVFFVLLWMTWVPQMDR